MLRASPSGVNSCTIEPAPAACRQETRGHAEEDRELATREEIADQMAGMTLFADLARAQMIGAASRFEEAFFPKDARILRQGLTGAGSYGILEGEAERIGDDKRRATLARAD